MQEGKTAALSYQQTLNKIIQHLDANDEASTAVACATLSILLSQSNEEAALDGLAAKLLKLVEAESLQVQRNAVAALSAAVEASETALQEVIASNAAQCLVRRLQQQGPTDLGLTANLLAALGALAEGSTEGAQSVVAAGGVEALVACCDPQQAQQAQQQGEEQLQEAAVDALCKVLGHGEEMRALVAAKGGISALASLLGSADSAEVRVRCLLGLGMLVGGNPERQIQLAAAPGAPAQLVALMRQGDDGDCQHIAANLFAELAKNPAAKESIAAALKGSQ